MNKKRQIYLDGASSGRVDDSVVKEVAFHMKNTFGNASSLHRHGEEAKGVLDNSRKKISLAINARPEEVFFTSGGTESDNIAFWGVLNFLFKLGLSPREMHVIVSSIEHSSIFQNAKEAEKKGVKVSFLPVGEDGVISLDAFKKTIDKNTVFISLMRANNETGIVQDIEGIPKILRHFGKYIGFKHSEILKKVGSEGGIPFFHSDWSQAVLYEKFDALRNHIDLATFDGQKMYGPKGVGALFKKAKIKLEPIFWGGGQEGGIRSGTENIPLIAGFALAFKLAMKRMNNDRKKVGRLRGLLEEEILKNFEGAKVNGANANRLPNISNIFIPKVDAEFLAVCLDNFGFSISTKGACLGDDESHTLRAMFGNKSERIRSSFRITVDKYTKQSELKSFIGVLKKAMSLQRRP